MKRCGCSKRTGIAIKLRESAVIMVLLQLTECVVNVETQGSVVTKVLSFSRNMKKGENFVKNRGSLEC